MRAMASTELVGFIDLTTLDRWPELVMRARESYHNLRIDRMDFGAGRATIGAWIYSFLGQFPSAPIDGSQLRQVMYEIWWDHRENSENMRECIRNRYCEQVADEVISYRMVNLYWYHGSEDMPRMIRLWLNQNPDHLRWLGRNARERKAWDSLACHVPEGDERDLFQEIWHTFFAVQYYENLAHCAINYQLGHDKSGSNTGFFTLVEDYIREIKETDESAFPCLDVNARSAIGYYCFQAKFPKPDAWALLALFSVPPLVRECRRDVKEGCCRDCDRELRVKRDLAIVQADREVRIQMREVEQAKKAALDKLQQEMEDTILPAEDESTVAVTCYMKSCSAHKKNGVHQH
ncbi:hypothetical protein B0T19DRAFT_400420 [Cercophora scortea]|uniref:Uncharacterized protein n=1 Tax=Cercophora scortea TaxID=314031 RepID=A0AAE0ILZ9_9PEZI|nr:hypothetical protein B0T19DRAFT_400420 [Cercophora scortea]